MKHIKKIIFSAFLIFVVTSVSAFPFLSEKKSNQSAAARDGITKNQIDELQDTITAIQKYYITDVSEKKLMDNALRGMVSQLDPHSDFLNKDAMTELDTTVSGEFAGIGVELTTDRGMLRVISPIEDSPAARANIKPGDLIIKINNKLIQDMTVDEAIHQIKGPVGSDVTLLLLRKDVKKPISVTVKREVVKMNAIKSKMLSPGYAYVRIALFQGPVADEMKKAIAQLKQQSGGKLKGLILDLRSNPGGLLDVSADVVDAFLDKSAATQYNNVIVYTKGRIPSADVRYYAKEGDIIEGTPMIVLINGGSASASEIAAGALQDYKRAIIMGSRSFGKGSVQTVIPISNNSAVKLTTALYYTPAGREIQAQGIEPDVIVPDLAVDTKPITGVMDFDEENYDHHILNNKQNVDEKKLRDIHAREAEKAMAKLAIDDYQLYEALMMLKGLHAIR